MLMLLTQNVDAVTQNVDVATQNADFKKGYQLHSNVSHLLHDFLLIKLQ